MSSARDIRAMVASIEKTMQQLRSARGADRDVDARKKAYADLEEDLADAAGALRMSKRSGVDSTRLSEKIIAAKALLTKFNPLSGSTVVDIEGSVVGGMSDLATRSDAAGSAVSHPENNQSQYLRAPRDDDELSVRSSIASRNEEERTFRSKEISLRRKVEDLERARQNLERERQDLEREKEDAEMELMSVRHKRTEAEAEARDSQSDKSSVGRSAGQSVGRISVSNSEERTEKWVGASKGGVATPPTVTTSHDFINPLSRFFSPFLSSV